MKRWRENIEETDDEFKKIKIKEKKERGKRGK
jgi:hypothetical protein